MPNLQSLLDTVKYGLDYIQFDKFRYNLSSFKIRVAR
jgi:hypothetical protein